MEKVEFKNSLGKSVGTMEIIDQAPTKATLNIYGDIVGNENMKNSDLDMAPTDVLELLKTVKNKNLTVNINSQGGSVFAGIGIYNAIKHTCKGKIIVNITGLAGSIASVIAMVGDTINMPMNTQMMIHKPSCTVSGSAIDLISTAKVLDTIQESIVNTYLTNIKSGISKDYISGLMDSETWLPAEKCQQLFKNVVVTGKGINNKCKDSNDSADNDELEGEQEVLNSEELEGEQEVLNEKKSETKDKKDSYKDDPCEEKDKCKDDKKNIAIIDNFEKELSIFLCQNLS